MHTYKDASIPNLDIKFMQLHNYFATLQKKILHKSTMYKNTVLILSLVILTFQVKSQTEVLLDTVTNFDAIKYHLAQRLIEGDDTLIHVPVREIIIREPFIFKSNRQRRRYSRLVRYVKKVYPYSKIVSKQLEDIDLNLNKYKTKKEKSFYIKQKERELKKQFEGKLRKLTFTQGRILIKLINRETGYTTYEIVKELKGSLSAFFWQSIARLFSSNLKLEYDAKGDDKMIEDIVIRIENGSL